MNKIKALTLALIILCSPVLALEQFREGVGTDSVLGTTQAADLGTNIFQQVVAPLDVLAKNYRNGCKLIKTSNSTLSILPGEIAISNGANGANTRFRALTTTLPVTWAAIDTGAEATSTQYYVHLLAETLDSSEYTATISLNPTAPDSKIYFRLIGYFYNDASGNIVSAGNYSGGGVVNSVTASGTTDITVVGSGVTDMTDMAVYFVSGGGPVECTFNAPLLANGASTNLYIDMDGTDVSKLLRSNNGGGDSSFSYGESIAYYGVPDAGAHTFKIQWSSSSTSAQRGSTDGQRWMKVEEK